jgi:hypothetical protein
LVTDITENKDGNPRIFLPGFIVYSVRVRKRMRRKMQVNYHGFDSNDERILGFGYGRPGYGRRPFGYGRRPFGFGFGVPFLTGLAAGALLTPRPYYPYAYPPYPYPYYYPYY